MFKSLPWQFNAFVTLSWCLACKLSLAALLTNSVLTVANHAEPDFIRLLPLSAYEQVQQGLIQLWQQAGQEADQLQTLTTLLPIIAQWEAGNGRGSWQRVPDSYDLARLVQQLDHILLQLRITQVRAPLPEAPAEVTVLKLCNLVRFKLVKLSGA